MLATGQAQAAFVCTISSWAGTVNLDQAEIAPSLHPTPASQQVSVHHQCPLPGPSCQSSFWELASLLARVQVCWVSLGFSETDHGSCPPSPPRPPIRLVSLSWWVITGYKASPPTHQHSPGRTTLAGSSVGEQRPLLVRTRRDTLRVEFQTQ